MGRKDKLIRRLKSNPKDFTFEEAETLLRYPDYCRSSKGKTSGSRVMFVNDEHGSISLHKPHPAKELKSYQVKQLAVSAASRQQSLNSYVEEILEHAVQT